MYKQNYFGTSKRCQSTKKIIFEQTLYKHPKDVNVQIKLFSNIQKMSVYKQNDFEHPKDVSLQKK